MFASTEGSGSRPGGEDGSNRRGGGRAAIFCAFGRSRSDEAPEVCVPRVDQTVEAARGWAIGKTSTLTCWMHVVVVPDGQSRAPLERLGNCVQKSRLVLRPLYSISHTLLRPSLALTPEKNTARRFIQVATPGAPFCTRG